MNTQIKNSNVTLLKFKTDINGARRLRYKIGNSNTYSVQTNDTMTFLPLRMTVEELTDQDKENILLSISEYGSNQQKEKLRFYVDSFELTLLQKYVFDCINLEAYEIETTDFKQTILETYKIFKSEYVNEYNLREYKNNMKKIFFQYLLGLPSVISTLFYHYDINKELPKLAIKSYTDDTKNSDIYFNMITDEFFKMLVMAQKA